MKKKNVVISNIVWRFAEKFGAQAVFLIVSIILARILSPQDYGTIGLVSIFVTVLGVFADSGLGTALIQKLEVDDLDYSTVFYTNILLSIGIYVLLFFTAPIIASFYERNDLIPIIRVLSLSIVVSSVKNVQISYVSRNMLFRRFFFSTLGGTLVAAIVGVYMAYRGYGVWALVTQQIVNMTIDTLILWLTVKWRPIWGFSFKRLKVLYKYGWKLLISALLDTGYSQLRLLIIGKVYSSSDLAYYNKADQFPQIIVTNLNGSIDSVLLPSLSKNQNDRAAVSSMTRRAIKVSAFIVAPLMLGMAAISRNMVLLILTDKWLPSVPYLCVFCISYMFYPIHTANLNAIKAMGRSDLFLKLELIKKIIGVILVLVTMRISVWAMCLSLLVSCIISQIINAYPNKKLLDYGYFKQFIDFIPSILLSAFMALIVFFVGKIDLPLIFVLMIQIVTGICVYILSAKLFKMEEYSIIADYFKTIFKQ